MDSRANVRVGRRFNVEIHRTAGGGIEWDVSVQWLDGFDDAAIWSVHESFRLESRLCRGEPQVDEQLERA